MRRWMATPFLFAALVAMLSLGSPREIQAQPPMPQDETIPTADGIQLRGAFHKSPTGNGNSPIIVFLYPPGKDKNMNKGGWEGLANRLNKEGYHVFRFDWRGHGKSTDITDAKLFWTNLYTGQWNSLAMPKNAKKGPLKTEMKIADLVANNNLNRFYPAFVNDLAAVRAHLDQKNDNGDINTSNVYFVGVGDASALGMMWITAEWNRPAVYAAQPGVASYEIVPDLRFPLGNDTGGESIAGAIWLSPSHPPTITDVLLRSWASTGAPKIRDNNHMLFLYGDKDAAGKKQSELLFETVLVGKGNPGMKLEKLDRTQIRPLAQAGTLSGIELLGNGNVGINTEETIVKYLAFLQLQRARIIRKQRNYSAPYLVDMAKFGFQGP